MTVAVCLSAAFTAARLLNNVSLLLLTFHRADFSLMMPVYQCVSH